jgi:chorismate synthase
MLRFLTAGESHGPMEVGILEGMPAGLPLSLSDVRLDLERRRFSAGRGGRGFIEDDEVHIVSGIRNGKTIGSPITFIIHNKDFRNWKGIDRPILTPRPGHADLAGLHKYEFTEARNVLERASARETVMRVAIGAACKKFLGTIDVKIASHTIRIGSVSIPLNSYSFSTISQSYILDPLTRCIDPVTAKKMKTEILECTKEKDTLGGVNEVVAINVPAGLGSYVHWDRRLDALLASALMSIPSVKAVEIGDALKNASQRGTKVHDAIFFEKNSFTRKTNRAGGIEGGVSNGKEIVVRVYHKPISTLGAPLRSVNLVTKGTEKAVIERSDICIVPRAGVIAEGQMAFVLANAVLEKFGGDSVTEFIRHYKTFIKRANYE